MKNKNIPKDIRFLGVNAAGIKSKMVTFKKVINELKPSVFFIEESKLKSEGKLKMEPYIIFEGVRETKEGGGLAIGCLKELKPVFVRKGENDVESLSVEISVQKMKIRCVVAYGPQENDLMIKKENFWNYLDEEVSNAWKDGSGFILQFDGNLWAGNEIIPGDPRSQNYNGKLFQDFLERNQNLSVVNSLPICEGLITRVRSKGETTEKSILDFFVVCSRILPFVTKMVIDEEKNYILTNYKVCKNGIRAKDSDHYTEYMDVKLKIKTENPKERKSLSSKMRAVFRNLQK